MTIIEDTLNDELKEELKKTFAFEDSADEARKARQEESIEIKEELTARKKIAIGVVAVAAIAGGIWFMTRKS